MQPKWWMCSMRVLLTLKISNGDKKNMYAHEKHTCMLQFKHGEERVWVINCVLFGYVHLCMLSEFAFSMAQFVYNVWNSDEYCWLRWVIDGYCWLEQELFFWIVNSMKIPGISGHVNGYSRINISSFLAGIYSLFQAPWHFTWYGIPYIIWDVGYLQYSKISWINKFNE